MIERTGGENMARSFARGFALGSVAVAALVIPHPAFAQERSFNIPAQEARKAIPEFARQAGIQISAPSTDGVKTNAVNGTMDVGTALRQLIRGTGLEIASSSAGMIVLRRAETPQGNAGAAEGESADGQPIVVTGTLLRGLTQIPSPIQTLDREEATKTGAATVAELVRQLPTNFGSINSGTVVSSIFGAGFLNLGAGSAVNLRGLGPESTLVLIEGARTAPSGGSEGVFFDISTIPLIAIERIEVVPDGASAAYGSDAVGGVVNMRLRRLRGVEVGLSQGISYSGDAAQTRASAAAGITFGRLWPSGPS